MLLARVTCTRFTAYSRRRVVGPDDGPDITRAEPCLTVAGRQDAFYRQALPYLTIMTRCVDSRFWPERFARARSRHVDRAADATSAA